MARDLMTNMYVRENTKYRNPKHYQRCATHLDFQNSIFKIVNFRF